MQEAAGLLRNAIFTLHGDDVRGKFIMANVLFDSTAHGMSDTPIKLIDGLMARLRLRLPFDMYPTTVIALDSMPHGSTGKTDCKKVQELLLSDLDSSPALQLGNLTWTEQHLLCLWQLLIPPWGFAGEVNRGTDFFLFGSNSLLLVKLQALIRKGFNDAPQLSLLINSPELGSIALSLFQGWLHLNELGCEKIP